ncbi:MAG: PorT family protein [Paludibacter sp.]|nr:PorT family protein [Paludibacter sp.]
MKKITVIILIIMLFSVFQINLFAQTKDETIKDYTPGILRSLAVGVEYRVKAGFLIGGMSPIPIPLEIQKIENYNPLFNLMLEGEIQKSFNPNWALSFGLRMEQKGMKTLAQVKNYEMVLIQDNESISGVWTGSVQTTVKNSYLTLPVLVVFKPYKRWSIKLGPYLSCLLDGSFWGYASDGYLRVGDPTGEKIEISNAPYDFSDKLAHWNYGLQLDADFQAFPHLFAGLNFTYGINSIFPKNFNTMSFAMHPIYFGLNFGYKF